MSYRNHHQSHYRVKFTDESQASEVEYPARVAKTKQDGPRFPNLHMMFKHKQDMPAEEVRVVERSVETIRQSDDKGVEKTCTYEEEENVDMVADEYIKRRHQKYQLQKLMSINTA